MKFRPNQKLDNDDFLKKLRESSWSVLNDVSDVNLCWNKWKKIFVSTIEEIAPLKQVRVREKTLPWITADLRKLMRKRDLGPHKCF